MPDNEITTQVATTQESKNPQNIATPIADNNASRQKNAEEQKTTENIENKIEDISDSTSEVASLEKKADADRTEEKAERESDRVDAERKEKQEEIKENNEKKEEKKLSVTEKLKELFTVKLNPFSTGSIYKKAVDKLSPAGTVAGKIGSTLWRKEGSGGFEQLAKDVTGGISKFTGFIWDQVKKEKGEKPKIVQNFNSLVDKITSPFKKLSGLFGKKEDPTAKALGEVKDSNVDTQKIIEKTTEQLTSGAVVDNSKSFSELNGNVGETNTRLGFIGNKIRDLLLYFKEKDTDESWEKRRKGLSSKDIADAVAKANAESNAGKKDDKDKKDLANILLGGAGALGLAAGKGLFSKMKNLFKSKDALKLGKDAAKAAKPSIFKRALSKVNPLNLLKKLPKGGKFGAAALAVGGAYNFLKNKFTPNIPKEAPALAEKAKVPEIKPKDAGNIAEKAKVPEAKPKFEAVPKSSAIPKALPKGGMLRTLGKGLKRIPGVGILIAGASTAAEASEIDENKELNEKQKKDLKGQAALRELFGLAGGTVGAVGGGIAGGVAGGVMAPAGAIAGGVGGSMAGEWLADKFIEIAPGAASWTGEKVQSIQNFFSSNNEKEKEVRKRAIGTDDFGVPIYADEPAKNVPKDKPQPATTQAQRADDISRANVEAKKKEEEKKNDQLAATLVTRQAAEGIGKVTNVYNDNRQTTNISGGGGGGNSGPNILPVVTDLQKGYTNGGLMF